MDELELNPDRCGRFEPNPFKKTKCKHCGRIWSQHLGVITEAQVQDYQKDKHKGLDDKNKKEAKRQNSVEDEFFGEGSEADDSDDDGGFKMLVGKDINNAPAPPQANKAAKIVNLIDFGECDVPKEQSEVPCAAIPLVPAACASSSDQVVMDRTTEFHFGSLQEENEHLKQMLRDADAEKKIQLEIEQDKTAEKQQLIDALMLQRANAEAALRDARKRLDALEEQANREIEAARADRDVAVAARDAAVRERDAALTERTATTAACGRTVDASDRSNADRREFSAATAKLGDIERVAKLQMSDEASPAHLLTMDVLEVNRRAAQTLKKLKLHADRQLAWANKAHARVAAG